MSETGERQVSQGLVALLACPVCRGELEAVGDQLTCAAGHRFELRNGVPLLASESPPFDRLAEWERKQQASTLEYQAEVDDPAARQAGAAWTVGRLFGEFWSAALSGATALDVGCGMYSQQAYFRSEWIGNRVTRLVGVDPLFHAGARDYDFVQGVAESLPFADSVFDAVLFATSLDHIVSIDAAMRESARVLKPGGTLAIWISVFDPGLEIGVSRALKRVTRDSPWRPRALASYLRVLYALESSRRTEWDDKYHLHRFKLPELKAYITRAGYSVSEHFLLDDGAQSVPHAFLRATCH